MVHATPMHRSCSATNLMTNSIIDDYLFGMAFWLLDPCASRRMTGHRYLMSNITSIDLALMACPMDLTRKL